MKKKTVILRRTNHFLRDLAKKTNKMGRSQTMNKQNEKAKCANLKVWITNFLNK